MKFKRQKYQVNEKIPFSDGDRNKKRENEIDR